MELRGWCYAAFAIEYSAPAMRRPRAILSMLAALWLVFLLLAFTDSRHGWVRADPVLVETDTFSLLMYGFTGTVYAVSAYIYLGFLIFTIFLIRGVFRSPRIYRHHLHRQGPPVWGLS